MAMIFEPNGSMKWKIKLIPITVEGVVSYTVDRTDGIRRPPPPLSRLRRLIKKLRRWM